MALGTNVNSTSVHRDCVEDADILLSDICFNEDFYSKPPTVEFTVIDEVTSTLTDKASSVIGDSLSSLRARRSSSSTSNVNNNSSSSSSNSSTNSSSNSIRNRSSSGSSVLNIAAQRSNTVPPSSSSSSSSLSAAAASASGSKVKATRMQPAELSLKVAYSSGVEIPLDYSLGQEISIYTSGRNRKVHYGLNGAPYYITDTGTVNTYVLTVPDLFFIAVLKCDMVTDKSCVILDVCKHDTNDDYDMQH